MTQESHIFPAPNVNLIKRIKWNTIAQNSTKRYKLVQKYTILHNYAQKCTIMYKNDNLYLLLFYIEQYFLISYNLGSNTYTNYVIWLLLITHARRYACQMVGSIE